MVKRSRRWADYVGTLSDDVEKLTDAELRAKTDEFKRRLAGPENPETLDDLLPEARRGLRGRLAGAGPAAVRRRIRCGRPAPGQRCRDEDRAQDFDLCVARLPHAGNGVHIVTVNDYLANATVSGWAACTASSGFVGVILATMIPDERRVAYNADITYGTNNEFGLDYLRDNMAHSLDDLVQRGHHYAIVDEVDSILIDEARTR